MKDTQRLSQPDIRRAYAHCTAVARHQAKNFYYAFLALPAPKRDAMCAMYAFMRRADDIADEETMPIEERRALMSRWREAFHANTPFEADDAEVFTAVRDTQQRFRVSSDLLDELVAGTAMDLSPEPPAGVQRMSVNGQNVDAYTTVEALDRYCYLVASVVGLVTIRIFGYSGEHADEDAVRLGKALQYTNILRDVREDAERGRVYLPLELLQQHGAAIADVLGAAAGHDVSTGLKQTMQDMASRAEQFYSAERSMIAALTPESRGAMRTLIGIYHALLFRIQSAGVRVFAERVRVSTPHKLLLLARGMLLRSRA